MTAELAEAHHNGKDVCVIAKKVSTLHESGIKGYKLIPCIISAAMNVTVVVDSLPHNKFTALLQIGIIYYSFFFREF